MAVQDITSTPINNQAIAMRMFLEAKADEEARKAAEKAGIVRTEIAPLGPGEEVELPSNMLYRTLSDPGLNRGLGNLAEAGTTALLGEGTGNTTADILLGLTGPGAAIGTAATGNRPGVLDMLPGGGALKGMAVLAVPKFSNIVRSVTRSTGQDLGVDVLRRAAQNSIDRLSRVTDHVVTPAEIEQAVADEISAMGDMSDAPKLRMYATTIAKDVLERAQESLAEGRAPDFVVRSIPPYMDIGRKATESANALEKERLQKFRANNRNRESLANLSVEDAQRVENIARQREQERYLKAISEGRSEKDARALASNIYSQAKLAEAGKIRTSMKQAAAGEKELIEAGSTVSADANGEAAVREAANAAYREAKDKALAEGLSEQEAIKVARLARARARQMKIDELGGVVRQAKLDAQKAGAANVRKVFQMLSPDIQEEIEKQANLRREIVRKQYLDNGATNTTATRKAAKAHDSEKYSLTREVLKELGFKNANDPRLAQYSQLRHDGNHVLATPTERTLMSPGTEQAAAYPVTPTERTLMAADPAQVNYSTSPAVGGALEDIADDEIDASIADGWFNKEYLEKLRQEWGH